jgi:O-antigen/teichoic acid export membrane protein
MRELSVTADVSLREPVVARPPAFGSRVANAAVWNGLSSALTRAANLLFTIVIARFIGTRGLGEIGMIQATVGVFGTLAGLGLSGTATRFVAEQRKEGVRAGQTLGLLFRVGLLSSGIALVCLEISAAWVAGGILGAPRLADGLRIAAPLLVLGALNAVVTGAVTGLEAFRPLALVGIAQALLSVAISFALVSYAGFWGGLVALIANGAGTLALSGKVLMQEVRERGIPLSLRSQGGDLGMIWHYAMPSFVASALVVPASWAARSALASRPHGYEQLGLFTAAYQWSTVVTFAPAVLAAVMLPILVSDQASVRLQTRYWKNVAVVAGTALLTALVLAIASGLLVDVYGPEFAAARPVLLVLLGAAVFDAANHALGLALSIQNRMWWTLAINALWGVELYLGALAFRSLGGFGLALAWACAYGLQTLQLLVAGYVLMRRAPGSPGGPR